MKMSSRNPYGVERPVVQFNEGICPVEKGGEVWFYRLRSPYGVGAMHRKGRRCHQEGLMVNGNIEEAVRYVCKVSSV